MRVKRQRHHRRPKSRGGTDHMDNISMVRPQDHVAFHRLFGNMLADEIAAMLTDVWIDPAYYLVAIPYRKRKPRKYRSRVYCVDCQCEILSEYPYQRRPSCKSSTPPKK